MQVRIASPRIPVIKRCGNHAREWRHDGCRHNRCKWRPRDSRRIPAHPRQLADGLVKSTHACAGHSSPTAALSDFGTVNVKSNPATACRSRRPSTDLYVAKGRPSGCPVTGSRPAYNAASASSITVDRVTTPAPSWRSRHRHHRPAHPSVRENSSHMSSKRRRRPTRRGCGTQFGWVAGTLAETRSR
jgi:hypothetical protein